jgi:hypothetical protein
MSVTADRPTRIASDLLDSATVEGARQSRSAKQQLDHWARVGRAVCGQQSAARMRVEAAFAGTLPLSQLSGEEAVVFNAEVQARVEENLRSIDLGAVLNARGITTVSLNENGGLVEYRPDGTSRPLETP